MENITSKLFEIIEERKITPYSLAVKSGIGKSDIYKYRKSLPAFLTALKIANALELKVNDIWNLK